MSCGTWILNINTDSFYLIPWHCLILDIIDSITAAVPVFNIMILLNFIQKLMWHLLWNLSVLLVTLGILIIVHEFGHFWVASRCGVTVTRVSIGFWHVLWRKFDKYGTEYVISAIPLGGYIQMLDYKVDKARI